MQHLRALISLVQRSRALNALVQLLRAINVFVLHSHVLNARAQHTMNTLTNLPRHVQVCAFNCKLVPELYRTCIMHIYNYCIFSFVGINIVQRPMDTTACAGSNATFTCVFFFSSGSSVDPTWRRNDVDVNLTRHTKLSNRSDSSTPVYIGTMVTVSSITTADDGARYQCIVLTFSSDAALNVEGNMYTCTYVHINFLFSIVCGCCIKSGTSHHSPGFIKLLLSVNLVCMSVYLLPEVNKYSHKVA